MAYIGNQHTAIGIEKLMIFKISGYKSICACSNCLAQQKTAGAAAKRHFPDGPAGRLCITDAAGF